jgi:hypothetical protein
MMFLGVFILNTISFSRMSKEDFNNLKNRTSVDNFMSIGPIFGPIRLFLYWSLIMTLVTF